MPPMALVMAFFVLGLFFGRLDVRLIFPPNCWSVSFGFGCVFLVFVLCVCIYL